VTLTIIRVCIIPLHVEKDNGKIGTFVVAEPAPYLIRGLVPACVVAELARHKRKQTKVCDYKMPTKVGDYIKSGPDKLGSLFLLCFSDFLI